MERTNVKSVIRRAPIEQQSVTRVRVEGSIRDENEVQAGLKQVGYPPHRDTKSWYRDIYEFYQSNEY